MVTLLGSSSNTVQSTFWCIIELVMWHTESKHEVSYVNREKLFHSNDVSPGDHLSSE